jgi:YHS domain-containing protein
MTAARRERKSRWHPAAVVAISAVLALAASLAIDSKPLSAATSERMVVNRYTGLAIDGFDPVAYFVDAEPKVGRAEFEFRYAGAVWQFVNEGNRAAFAARPDVYAPQFGGYDAIAIARGASAPGHPRLWRIAGKRLYLFYSEAARQTFTENPASAIEAAERHWPEVMLTLAP